MGLKIMNLKVHYILQKLRNQKYSKVCICTHVIIMYHIIKDEIFDKKIELIKFKVKLI